VHRAEVRPATSERVRIVAFMVLFVLAIGAITWLSSRALGLNAAATAAMLLCTMFMNAGNYGLPVARFAFNQEGFERAALFFVVQVILAQTLAIYIAGAGHGDLREGLTRLLRMPPLYAVLTALAVRLGWMRSALMGDGVLGDLFRGVALVGDASVYGGALAQYVAGVRESAGGEWFFRGLDHLAVVMPDTEKALEGRPRHRSVTHICTTSG
jgi:hypothetical protein